MAPKRTLEQSDANIQSTRDPKQQKRDETGNDAENREPTDAGAEKSAGPEEEQLHKELEKKKPEEYICIDQPRWGRVKLPKTNDDEDEDEDDEDEDENESEDDDERLSDQDETTKMHLKSPSEHPEWKWTMSWKSWQMLCEWSVRSRYTDPDNFEMYIYNDFHGYGMIEMVENAVVEFNKEWKKKDGSLHLTWAPLAMLGFWLNNNDTCQMMGVDDGARVFHLVKLIGYALLTGLHAIDTAGKLKKDSEIRDLGLVMTLYLGWAHGLDEDADDEEDLTWRETVVAYAKKAGIDLKTVGCAIGRELEDIGDAEPLENSKKADRWDWKKVLKEYTDSYGIRKGHIGGQRHDITKMSSRERAEYAFDKVDPLKDVPKDVLKENRLDFGM